ncbi:hypothetical protein LUZ60_012295 [Juncus effusus]|nr:hypothetical protein LUZ60_012295 [Juncus effusus]
MALIGSQISCLKFNYLQSYVRFPKLIQFGFRRKSEDLCFVIHKNRFNLAAKIKESKLNIAISDTQINETLEIFEFNEDQYDGIIINHDSLPDSSNLFLSILNSSLSFWKSKGKKGVWLKILEHQADLVPIALKAGFKYHHAELDYIVLTYWIPNGPSLLPYTATHQIGVGAFVINQNNEVLVVKEKKCLSCCSGVWKIPTGFVNKSEDIFSGVIREVKEETGIDTSFLEVVAFRHAHQVIFDQSDILFICMLKPISFNISIDESEIENATWMALDEFENQEFHKEDEMSRKIIEICKGVFVKSHGGFKAEKLMSKLDDKNSYLYYPNLEA